MLQSDYERVHQYLFFPSQTDFSRFLRWLWSCFFPSKFYECMCGWPALIYYVQESLLQLAGRTTEIGSTFFGADGVVAGDAVNASMVVRSFFLIVVEEDDFAVIQSLD